MKKLILALFATPTKQPLHIVQPKTTKKMVPYMRGNQVMYRWVKVALQY